MARKYLVDVDLSKNQLLNARVQNLASAPSSPVAGQQYYDTTLNQFGIYNGSAWVYMGSGTGDLSSNTATSVDSEVVVFNGTTGKSVKRATGTGIPKLTSGVLSIGTAGTDYTAGTSALATGILKNTTGTGAHTIAVQGTDYYAPGGTDVAVADGGTGASTLTGVLKGNGTAAITGSATLNDVGAPTADFSMNSRKLTSVLDPTAAQDAATKNYVDNSVQGLSWKTAARAATTANVTLSAPQTIDGVSVIAGDRVLVKDQSTASQNGIYLVAAGAWTRTLDADTSAELVNATIYVSEGTANADTVWTLTTNAPITVGTTSLAFAQVNGGTVAAASTTVAGKVELATQAEAEARSDATLATTPASLVNFPVKKTFTIGDGATTSIGVTHSLGTKEVITQVRQAADDAVVECDIVNTSTSVVTLTFATAPALNAIKVVVMG